MMCFVLVLLPPLIVTLTKRVANKCESGREMECQDYDQVHVVVGKGLSQLLSLIVELLHQNTLMLTLQSWCSIGFSREISILWMQRHLA